jgi:class 3 adenylate cyclase
MSGLPSGTVTFLFTDIEGSTQRWQQQPDAMGSALARHDQLVRGAIEAHGGQVFKTVGDAFCAAFADPTAALAASLTAQRSLYGEPWGVTGPLRVRMALHTGRAEVQDGDYVGAPLNRVARLLSAGHGGQVLLSGATAELVQDHLPAEVHLRDLGTHQLKDLYRPEHVFQLVTPDLPADFSALATADHLPPYPAGHEATIEPAPIGPIDAVDQARPGHRRLARVVLTGGGLLLVMVVIGGAYFAANQDSPTPTAQLAAATSAPTVDPFTEGSGAWGTLATPPPAPAFVVFGTLVFDAGWKGAAQTLPGPMLLYAAPGLDPPTVWFGEDATLKRTVGSGAAGREEAIAPGSYVDLRPDDAVVVPANTPFAVQTGQSAPAALVALIVFPSGPPATAPDVTYWDWWSWGTVAAWPRSPMEVQFEAIELAPGESAPLPERPWPQLVYVDNEYVGPPLALMLTSGGGETMPVGGAEGKQPIDLDAPFVFAPGRSGTPGVGISLRESREPIRPGSETALGGTLLPVSAFLEPGTGGTLRNPGEAGEPVGVITVSFAPAPASN